MRTKKTHFLCLEGHHDKCAKHRFFPNAKIQRTSHSNKNLGFCFVNIFCVKAIVGLSGHNAHAQRQKLGEEI